LRFFVGESFFLGAVTGRFAGGVLVILNDLAEGMLELGAAVVRAARIKATEGTVEGFLFLAPLSLASASFLVFFEPAGGIGRKEQNNGNES